MTPHNATCGDSPLCRHFSKSAIALLFRIASPLTISVATGRAVRDWLPVADPSQEVSSWKAAMPSLARIFVNHRNGFGSRDGRFKRPFNDRPQSPRREPARTNVEEGPQSAALDDSITG